MAEMMWEDVKVGDGVTVNYWTDAHACTVIARTAKSLTLRRDKAILDPSFKPEFIAGGFFGTVINQNEQSYTYEPDENGMVMKAYYSKAKKGFYCDKTLRVTLTTLPKTSASWMKSWA